MQVLSQILVLLVALLHIYFFVLEMFLWDKPLGRKIFKTTAEFAAASKALAANQGLYNGFLAAGLLWGLSRGDAGRPIQLFFLCCVVIAGAYGGYSVNRRILFVQGLPAAIAGLLIWLS